MSGARIRELELGTSFVVECDCSGDWRELERVEGALEGFETWNANHALAGHVLTCRGCGVSYALGARLELRGLPDLIRVDELLELPRLELSRLQRRALDASLIAEETLWERAMVAVKAALAARDEEAAGGHWLAARLLRAASRRERRRTLLAILEEHNAQELDPAKLRIARLEAGTGAVYAFDRGPLPFPKRELEEEAARVVDLEAWGFDQEEEEELRRELVRVVDLS